MVLSNVPPHHSCTAQIDRLYGWESVADSPVREAFERQKDHVRAEFEQRSDAVFLALNEQVGGWGGWGSWGD